MYCNAIFSLILCDIFDTCYALKSRASVFIPHLHIYAVLSLVHYFPIYYIQFYALKASALLRNILHTHLHCEAPCITTQYFVYAFTL